MALTGGRLPRRVKRALWAASGAALVALAAGLVLWRVQKDREPEEYLPGEASNDITSVVTERGLAKRTPAQQEKRAARDRRAGTLADPGKPLPPGAPAPLFTDVTSEAGLGVFRQFAGGRTSQLPEDMGSGLAWGDFDNDGREDLFAVSGGGGLTLAAGGRAPSMLFRNLGGGRFERVTDFDEPRILGMGAAWADLDNDGWLDLVVTGIDTILLYKNHHGRLMRDRRFKAPRGFWAGVSFGDFDGDGALDFYVCGYVKYEKAKKGEAQTSLQFGKEVPFTLNPASYEAERNLLYRNNGDGTFSEAGRRFGVDNPEGRSLSALWLDFDRDGRLDLYVANDISENKLYLNRGSTFIDAGKNAWVAEYRGSMGLAEADFDRDGDEDLFISHWVAQGFALYQNLMSENGGKGGLHFTDVAEIRGIGQPTLQSIGWGAAFADFDSDGWLDLVVANGSTFEEKGPRPRKLAGMESFLFWNAGGEFFHQIGPWSRSLSGKHVSRGLAVADYDNDGSPDIAMMDHGEGLRLLRNDMARGNWVILHLRSRVKGRPGVLGFGDGAEIEARAGGQRLRRVVSSASYLSQDSRKVHLGLGAARKVDRLAVRWGSGRVDMWQNLEANRAWELVEGEKAPRLAGTGGARGPAQAPSRARTIAFWEKQRQGMEAFKRGDYKTAAGLLREALAIQPDHEDSHYYLANALAAVGDAAGALRELDAMVGADAQSRRAWQRKGELMAGSARSRGELEKARAAMLEALRLHPEETGIVELLGEVDLVLGRSVEAEGLLAKVCQANPRAAVAWFLRGYAAWCAGDGGRAKNMLAEARKARGKEWHPAGSVMEGDVRGAMVRGGGYLNLFEREWDGSPQPEKAFSKLKVYVEGAGRAFAPATR